MKAFRLFQISVLGLLSLNLATPSHAGRFMIIEIASSVRSQADTERPYVAARSKAQYQGRPEITDRTWLIGAQLRPAFGTEWWTGTSNTGHEKDGIPTGMIIECGYDDCGGGGRVDACTSANTNNSYTYRGSVGILNVSGDTDVDTRVAIGELECTPDLGLCEDESYQTSSVSYGAQVTPLFTHYQGDEVDASMTVSLTENPDSASPSVQTVTIDAPGETTSFPDRLAACSRFEAAISQNPGMRCSVLPTTGVVDGPVELQAYCVEMPSDICELVPFFCEVQDPDGVGIGRCQFVMRSVYTVVRLDFDFPGGTGIGTGEIWRTVAVALCPGGQSAVSNDEPVVHLRNGDGSIYEAGSTAVVAGVARFAGQGVAPTVFVDGQPVTLANFEYGLQDDDTCSEIPDPNCTPLSGFRGELDLSGYAQGSHRLSVGFEAEEAAAFHEIEFEIGSDSGGAQVIEHTLPTNKSCGEAWTSTVTLRNTGADIWTSAGCYKLAPVGDSDPFAGNTRFPLPGGQSVAPGEEVTFTIPMTAPATSGALTTDWRMIAEVACGGAGWFGETAESTVTLDCQKNARVVSHSLPSSMECGETKTATISLENTGTAVWREGQLYYLGARGGSDPFSIVQTFGLPDPEVLPGETVDIDVRLRAGPLMSGTFTTDWGLYHNGVGFGQTASSQVQVSCNIDDAAVVSHTIPPIMTCGETAQAEMTLRNTGATSWSFAQGSGYVLASVGTNPLRPEPPFWFPLPAGVVVEPNTTWTWTVPLTAPAVPTALGLVSTWRLLKIGKGHFGDPIVAAVHIDCPGELEVTGPNGLLQDGGSVNLGTLDPSVLKPFGIQLCNRGDTEIVISRKGNTPFIIGPASGFFETQPASANIWPGSCTSIEGYFQKAEGGLFNGTIRFYSSTQDEEDPFEIDLYATVTAPNPPKIRMLASGRTVYSGSTVDFGEIEFPGEGRTIEFQICNDGASPLEIGSPSMTGDPAFYYLGIPEVVQPSLCEAFDVIFETNFVGPASAIFSIPSNDLDENPVEITLTGTAVPRSN